MKLIEMDLLARETLTLSTPSANNAAKLLEQYQYAADRIDDRTEFKLVGDDYKLENRTTMLQVKEVRHDCP